MTDPTAILTAHERAVVGAALIAPDVLDEVSGIITSADFHDPRLSTIYAAAMALFEAGQPVTALTVSDALNRAGDLDRVGGRTAVHTVSDGVPAPSAAPWHAQRVRDAAMLRRVDAAAARLRALAAGGVATEDEALAAVDAARSELDTITAARGDEAPHAEAVWEAIKALDDPPGDPTPWPQITKAIAGWKPGALYVFGARPATGKSVAAVMATVDMARRHKTACLFSLEMTKKEIYHRMLVASAQVDMQRLQRRTLTADDRARLERAARDIAALPMHVSDRPTVSVAQVRAQVRAQMRGGDVGLVVVDHLGLMSASASSARQDRRVQVDTIARDLKGLAMELEVPVVALSQLNRSSSQRSDGRPQMSDLRESGEIEQSADVVFLMHRDTSTPELATELEIAWAKNRHGPTGVGRFNFRGHYSLFEDEHEFSAP